VVTYKQEDLPKEVGVEDFEKGRLDRLTEYPWMTDDTISWGSWCYTKNLEIKSTQTVLHTFIDIVSKNGVLLLNVSPMADGTIPDDQKDVLKELGSWLVINGEAIYATRPWKTFGQGPTRMKKSGAFVGRVDYTANDIRFTQSKDRKAFYAIVLGKPQGEIKLEALKVDSVEADARIQLLGSPENVAFRIEDDRTLTIQAPELTLGQPISEYAFVFKLSGFELDQKS
jgi:alpha-L-fucosidase